MRLEYFLGYKFKDLFAYDESSEFFVRYDRNENKWERCNFSFMNFEHDVDYKEVSEQEAKQITNNNLPFEEYNKYIQMLNDNLQGK